MTTVLLTGTYSSHNKGDLAMQLTAAGLLQARGIEVVSSVPFPEIDSDAYAEAGVTVVPSNRRQLIRATWQLARLALWRAFGRKPGWLVSDRNLEPFRTVDLVLDLSGDMLTEDYGPHVAYSHFLPLLTTLLLGRPLVLLAQSIGPFRVTKPLARSILRRADLITVRDPVSRTYLLKLGLVPPTVTADLAFALRAAGESDTNPGWLQSEADPRRPVLGVSISNLTATHHAKRGPGPDFFAEVAAALDSFMITHRAEVVFLPHVTGPSPTKDDRVAAERVRMLMKQNPRTVKDDLAPEAVKALIGSTTWFLGCRMHANIAALSSLVPTAAIAYSHKTPGIMQRLGLEHLVLDVADVTAGTIVELLDLLVASGEETTVQLREVLPSIRADAIRNIDLALDVLAGTTT